MEKVFLEVVAKHSTDGSIRPLSLTWSDGRIFTIDRVLDVRMAGSLKMGGQGMRYTCRIHGKEIYLFCDEGRWFLEPK